MEDNKSIKGFSKLSKRGKLRWIAENFFKNPEGVAKEIMSYWLHDEEKQRIHDGFSENTISNFILPYGVAPNLLLNGQIYCVPMVIEESSVVAAAAAAAKYWQTRGGFHAEVIGTKKLGQIHLYWSGTAELFASRKEDIFAQLRQATQKVTANMEARGGGISKIELLDFTDQEPNYFQLLVTFETCDSMGANFINTVLETFTKEIPPLFKSHFDGDQEEVEVIMSILSNYNPECLVKAWVSCPVSEMDRKDMSGAVFAERFRKAIRIAEIDPHRAATHNKGIFNGIDAVVLATGNDFRAIEAGGHTYASKSGRYQSLSHCNIVDGEFHFELTVPLALGTVGGLTALHPMAKKSLELLNNPTAEELMMIVAATGLAQNFSAVRSLVTTGIQKGHMKLHLANILRQLEATEEEMQKVGQYFADKVVSFSEVRDFITKMRSQAIL